MRVSGLELGGLFGSLLAGKLSDILINSAKGKGGNVGKRIQVGCRGRGSSTQLVRYYHILCARTCQDMVHAHREGK